MKEPSTTGITRDLLTQLIEHSNDAILCLSHTLEIINLNPVVEKILGWDKNDSIGKG